MNYYASLELSGELVAVIEYFRAAKIVSDSSPNFKKYIFTKAYINLTDTILVPFNAGEGQQTNEFSGEQTSTGFPCSKPLSVHDHTIKAIAVED